MEKENDVTKFSNLKQIADWQLDIEKADVGLPALQRGYVWKPKQVETLWDSLLRGFPIGSFLVSEKGSQDKKDLLDGQQRATAIAMGYYNPWDETKHPNFFSNRFRNIETTVPILWLDIGAKDDISKGENNDFIFLPRLITQSHPWGYSLIGKKLDIGNRSKAKEAFDTNILMEKLANQTYPHYFLKKVYPWDAELPIPMNFLIDSIGHEDWRKALMVKCNSHLSHVKLRNGDNVAYFKKLQIFLDNSVSSEKINNAFKRLRDTEIPIITLKRSTLEDEASTVSTDDSTLFVRLNTLGTPLNGEELIYSIFKTAFPDSKDVVESAGAGFIAPSRIITLISRIVMTDIQNENSATGIFDIPKQLKVKEFRGKIKNVDDPFTLGIKRFIEKGGSLVNLLFSRVKQILIGDENYQLPVPLAVDICKSNGDILYILLFWIHKADINDSILDETLHKKILAAITSLFWFLNFKNLEQLLKEFSKNDLLKEGKPEFWGKDNFKNIYTILDSDGRSIFCLLKPDDLKARLDKKFGRSLAEVFGDGCVGFISKLFGQRGLLLFVQRKYIKSKFGELQWDTLLEDTNRPWDWDHLYPSVYNQRNTYQEIRDVNNTIGNLRIWDLVDNRSDQDKLPSEKFGNEPGEDRKVESFITNDWEFWNQIDRSRITNDTDRARIVCSAIYLRIANIYKEWYDTLSVDELFD